MVRRKLTLKQIDPWSVLKFGAAMNAAMVVVGFFAFWILWFAIGRLGLVDQFCGTLGTLIDFGDGECGLTGGAVFKWWFLLSILGAIVATGVMVLGAFLYNLVADLTGGLQFSFLDESSVAEAPRNNDHSGAGSDSPTKALGPVPPHPDRPAPQQRPQSQPQSQPRSRPEPPPTRKQEPTRKPERPAPSKQQADESPPERPDRRPRSAESSEAPTERVKPASSRPSEPDAFDRLFD